VAVTWQPCGRAAVARLCYNPAVRSSFEGHVHEAGPQARSWLKLANPASLSTATALLGLTRKESRGILGCLIAAMEKSVGLAPWVVWALSMNPVHISELRACGSIPRADSPEQHDQFTWLAQRSMCYFNEVRTGLRWGSPPKEDGGRV
jgi:hypothetical protein